MRSIIKIGFILNKLQPRKIIYNFFLQTQKQLQVPMIVNTRKHLVNSIITLMNSLSAFWNRSDWSWLKKYVIRAEEAEEGNLQELYPFIIPERITKTNFAENLLELKFEAFWKRSWELTVNRNRATICTYYEEIHCNHTYYYLNVYVPIQIGCIFSEMLNMKHFQ